MRLALRRIATAAGVLVVGVGLVLLLRANASNLPPGTRPGNPAPDFRAVTLGHPAVERGRADYEGSPMLLNVWATWCDPCREEMPSLESLHRDYGDRGLRIVAISIDDAGNEELVREFAAEHKLTFDILHDPRASIMRDYQVRGVPQTFLVSRSGEIVATRFAEDWGSPVNRALVDSLMRSGTP
ncbi:MAG: TlpA disulfide reductase family protein [Gemmatimonadota bacterium]